ncbi:hypothetical protein RUM43_001960 [Polyplax serrata]|uniref:Uncharacterized protein n=1 Tax=Polyplax serrata TaxID=468196 RepID=A0AAN8RVL4_POLSC
MGRRQQAEEVSCASHLPREDDPPDTGQMRAKNTTQDLFELLERVQSARIDDQRCVLPSYFAQRESRSDLFLVVSDPNEKLNVKIRMIFRCVSGTRGRDIQSVSALSNQYTSLRLGNNGKNP